MNREDERDDQQDRFDANAETESAAHEDAQDSGEMGDIDVVDVQLGPEAFATTAPAEPAGIEPAQTSDVSNESEMLSVDQSSELSEPPPATLPVLDNDGNVPRFMNTLTAGLRLWEEAAAEVPGDPHFTPQPTNKPREELSVYRRSPWGKDVWFDRETMTPVLHDEPQPFSLPPSKPVEGFPAAANPAQDAADAQRELGTSRTPLIVTLAQTYKHYLDALDERMPLFHAHAREIARQEIETRAMGAVLSRPRHSRPALIRQGGPYDE